MDSTNHHPTTSRLRLRSRPPLNPQLKLLLGLIVFLFSSHASAELKNFTAKLDDLGAMPDPPGTPTGEALFTYDTTTQTFCGKIVYPALAGGTVTKVALVEIPGTAIKDNLQVGASPLSVSTKLTEAEVAKIEAGDVFVTLLTAAPYNTLTNGALHGVLNAGGTGQTCAGAAPDAGTGSTTSSTSSSSSSGAPSGSSTSSGAAASSGEGGLAPVESTAPPADDGCNAGGSTGFSGWVLVGLSLAALMRGRRRNRTGP